MGHFTIEYLKKFATMKFIVLMHRPNCDLNAQHPRHAHNRINLESIKMKCVIAERLHGLKNPCTSWARNGSLVFGELYTLDLFKQSFCHLLDYFNWTKSTKLVYIIEKTSKLKMSSEFFLV